MLRAGFKGKETIKERKEVGEEWVVMVDACVVRRYIPRKAHINYIYTVRGRRGLTARIAALNFLVILFYLFVFSSVTFYSVCQLLKSFLNALQFAMPHAEVIRKLQSSDNCIYFPPPGSSIEKRID